MASRREQLVGNRLALAGTVLYFMERVVIPFAPSLPTDKLSKDHSAIVAAYGHHPARTAFLAGWLSFVLLGRIAFSAGLRSAFRASPREPAWADGARGAMARTLTRARRPSRPRTLVLALRHRAASWRLALDRLKTSSHG